MPRFSVGDIIVSRTLTNSSGIQVRIPDPERLVHLQLRRYAGCPICNSHLRSVAMRISDIEAAGVREVVVFHSSRDEVNSYAEALPFESIPDPERRLYEEFGVESSFGGVLRPSVAAAAIRGFRKGHLIQQVAPGQDHFGVPGDFLIEPSGRLVALHYGRHAADQWSVDELLALVAAHEATDASSSPG